MQSSEGPPVFPKFPLPPGGSNDNRGDGSGRGNKDDRRWGTQYPAEERGGQWAAGNYSSESANPLLEPHTRREEAANAAIQSTAEHWIHEQARRKMRRQTGEAGPNVVFEGEMEDKGERYKCSLEFVTGSPKFLWRVILLLAVGLFGAIPLMSPFALTVLLTGCIVTYAADFAGYRRGCILAIICTTGLFGVSLFLSNLRALISNVGPLCMILSLFGLLIAASMTSFMHFHWMQLSYPELICFMERCVLGVTPLLTLPSLLSTITALVGSRHAPAWFMINMCIIHYYFYGPMESSFLVQRRIVQRRRRNEANQEDKNDNTDSYEEEETRSLLANGRTEAITFILLLILLPALIYICFQSNFMDTWLPNMVNILGMMCGAVAYLCVYPEHSLWFLLPERDTVQCQLESDPLGIQDIVKRYRKVFLTSSMVIILHWSIYRVLHSRYRFLFDGLPPPLNGVCLAFAMYFGLYAAYQIKILLDADTKGEDTLSRKYITRRAFSVLSAVLSSFFLGVSTGIPGIFIILMILCVTSVNLFLLDRVNAGPMVSFTVFSSLLLMWWMHRMFSFIVVDLHVLGESTTVPTPVVTMSVLWCYVLSCIAFTLSFSTNKIPFLVVLFAHSLQVAWVEHVLYSQKEDNVYPAILVLITTLAGVFLSFRLYKNETLGIHEASFIAASYIAKVFTFVVEVTGSYYLSESIESDNKHLQAIEIGLGWWSTLFAGFVIMVFELKKEKQMRNRLAKHLTALYIVSVLIMSACTARNFQRAVYEFLTQTRLAGSNSIHVILGTSFIFFALMTYPFFSHHAGLHTFFFPLKAISRGTLLVGIIFLITQPTRIVREHEDEIDYGWMNEDMSRYCSIAGMVLLVSGRFFPMSSLHFALRALYWLITTLCLSVGLSMYILPVPSLLIFSGVCGFVYFSLLTLDVTHYRELSFNEGWIVYGVSICFMIFSLVVMGRVNIQAYTEGNPLVAWGIYTTGRRRQLSATGVIALFMAIVMKFRLSKKPLLPNVVPLTPMVVEQVGPLLNYTTVIAVSSMSLHNIWCNVTEPGLQVATSLFLLLLTDDGVFFTGLGRGQFRYFPVLLYTVGVLWVCLLHDAYVSSPTATGGVIQCVWSAVCALPVVPSHVSLLLLLWFGRKRGGTPTSGVLFFVALDLLCLLLYHRKTLQWMAIVGICGQCTRLFEAQFWKKRLETIL